MWRALLDTVDVDVRGGRALDAGCNQGGFLRGCATKAGSRSGTR
jgi:predicted rRNA methylase YqxC with S4 and FtsJ domains